MSHNDWKPEDLVEEGVAALRRLHPTESRVLFLQVLRDGFRQMRHAPFLYVDEPAASRFEEVLVAVDRMFLDAYERQQRGEPEED